MPFVVLEGCVKCKYTDCVEVCPVDCFHEGENMLVINPDECIDCGACEPECPAEAILDEEDLSEGDQVFIAINAVFSGAMALDDADTSAWPSHLAAGFTGPWPVIDERRDPLPGADSVREATGKLAELSPRAGG